LKNILGGVSMSIKFRIKEIRKSCGVTSAHVSTMLERSKSWLSNVESGRREISAKDLKAVADVLRIPVQEFYSEEPYRGPEQILAARILMYCSNKGVDPDKLNAEIGQPVGWLQQLPKQITPTQLTKMVNYLGFTIDSFAVGV
jgi:transcriptional regulator with XRE-family HTH domain